MIATLLISSWSIAINVMLIPSFSSLSVRSTASWVWLSVFALLNFGMLSSAWFGWHLLATRAGPALDGFLRDSPDRSARVDAWLRRRTRPTLQIVIALLGAGAASAALFSISESISLHLELGLPSHLMVAWTGMIGATVNLGRDDRRTSDASLSLS